METAQPSRTAWITATYRAEHQVLDDGKVFCDPLALRILGVDAEHVRLHADDRPFRRAMRLFVSMRARFAEDALALAIEGGVRQVVILGAGLDTYAYRGALDDRLHIFEVDHPATQAWKRQRLTTAGITPPAAFTFAPVDFERETLREGLLAAGFDFSAETFFTWLGVVPYLTHQAIVATLTFIASLQHGAHVVFDYSNPPDSLSPQLRAIHEKRAARLAEWGEALQSYFTEDELHASLRALGFTEIEDLSANRLATRYLSVQARSPDEKGGRVLLASTLP